MNDEEEIETCEYCSIILDDEAEHLEGCEMRREYCFWCGCCYYGKHEHDEDEGEALAHRG